MSDDGTTNGFDDRSEDAGKPIADLDGFDQPTSAGFLASLRARIERRRLTGQFASLVWHVPKMLIIEFLELIFNFVGSPSDREGDSK